MVTYSLYGSSVSGAQAIAQSVAAILSVEKGEWPIYPHSFGITLSDLFGRPHEEVQSYLISRISDALLRHDEIDDVRDFVFEADGDKLRVTFNVVCGNQTYPSEYFF